MVSDFKDHASSRGATSSSIPSFQNPLLTAHAVQQWSRRPTGRQQDGTCGKCGRSHERGNCPAYGVKCFKCGNMNHFKQFCHSRNASSSSKQGSLRIQRKASSSTETDGHLGTSKARAREAMAKEEEVHPTRRNSISKTRRKCTAVTLKENSVPSEANATGPVDESNVRVK